MKVGILTFINTVNYGAELQGFALCKKIEKIGHDSELINYTCNSIYEMNRPKRASEKARLIVKVKRAFAWSKAKSRWDKFRRFEETNRLIGKVRYEKELLNELENKYDVFILGSDQIWNYDLTKEDSTFFLPFINDSSKVFTYAASFGYSAIPEKYYSSTEVNIKKLKNKVLMREKTGEDIVHTMFSLDADTVVDPTFLLKKDEWEEFIRPSVHEKYILLYLVSEDSEFWQEVFTYSKRNNCRIVWITPNRHNDRRIHVIRDAGPEEFLNYIYHAEKIFTGSFHAVCFSLIFEKRFCYYPKDSAKANRVTNLLATLKMPYDNEIPISDKSKEILTKEIEKSNRYILSFFQKISNE